MKKVQLQFSIGQALAAFVLFWIALVIFYRPFCLLFRNNPWRSFSAPFYSFYFVFGLEWPYETLQLAEDTTDRFADLLCSTAGLVVVVVIWFVFVAIVYSLGRFVFTGKSPGYK